MSSGGDGSWRRPRSDCSASLQTLAVEFGDERFSAAWHERVSDCKER